MRILLAVDKASQSGPVINLVEALRFRNAHVDVVHVLELLGEQFAGVPITEKPDQFLDYVRAKEESCTALLDEVTAALRRRGFALDVQAYMTRGFVANQLVYRSEESAADLVALGVSDKDGLKMPVTGSVTRKTVITTKSSFLIGRGDVNPAKRLTVLFATDHSPYADRCVDAFAAWAPGGIQRLVVSTIIPPQLAGAIDLMPSGFKASAVNWTRSELERSNERVLERLKCFYRIGKSRIDMGNVSESLEIAMRKEKADLLVLGAQGNGFAERSVIGSVALEQALNARYPVLVIRA